MELLKDQIYIKNGNYKLALEFMNALFFEDENSTTEFNSLLHYNFITINELLEQTSINLKSN